MSVFLQFLLFAYFVGNMFCYFWIPLYLFERFERHGLNLGQLLVLIIFFPATLLMGAIVLVIMLIIWLFDHPFKFVKKLLKKKIF